MRHASARTVKKLVRPLESAMMDSPNGEGEKVRPCAGKCNGAGESRDDGNDEWTHRSDISRAAGLNPLILLTDQV
jgi:hypothetical protein